MFESPLIVFTFCLLLLSIKRAGYVPFPTGLIAILGLSQILFALGHEGVIRYTMLDVFNYGGLHKSYALTQVVYSLAALLSLIILTGKLRDLKAVRLYGETLASMSKSSTTLRYVFIAVILVALHLVLFLVVVDWQKLWLHRIYLERLVDNNTVDLLGVAITETIMRSTPFFALLSIVCLCLLTGSRSVVFRVVAGLMSLCYFLILLAMNSRSAAFVPGLAAIYYSVLRLKGRAIVVPLLGCLTALTITSVLIARGTYEHGLSMILSYLVRPFTSGAPENSAQVFLDLFQGIFVTAESIQITDDFPRLYKILSFSPLPSLIDGYSKSGLQSQHRLSANVPMSGVGEAINFGWPYICLLVAGLTVMIRTHVKLAAKSPIVFLLCNFMIMFSVYLLFSYPLRLSLRYAWFAFYIALFEIIRQKWLSQRLGQREEVAFQISPPTRA
jgi:hypothetical protein